MDVKSTSNNNSIWQAILKIFDANRTEENKETLDSVKEQIKPFFEETPDANVSLDVNDTPTTDVSSETSKVKEGEVGSYTWILNSIRNGLISGNVSQENIQYDEEGRVKSLYAEQENVTTTGHTSINYQKFDITYNNDGTINVVKSNMYSNSNIEDIQNITEWTKTSESVINPDGTKKEQYFDEEGNIIKSYDKEGNLRETWYFDKDGNEITGETQKVKDGEVGSESYIKNLFKAINEKSISEISYDESGRILSFKTEPNSSSGASYSVKYNENGTVEIHEILTTQATSRLLESDYTYDKNGNFVEQTDRINYAVVQDGGVSSEIRKYDSSGNLIETKKYDKDGKEIKDTEPNESDSTGQTTPQSHTVSRWNNKSTDRTKKGYNSWARNNSRYNMYSLSNYNWRSNIATILKNMFSRLWK